MWRYGIGEAPPIKRKHDNDAEKKEKDKQYEAKRERSSGACPGIRKRGAQNLKAFFFFFLLFNFSGGGAQLRK